MSKEPQSRKLFAKDVSFVEIGEGGSCLPRRKLLLQN